MKFRITDERVKSGPNTGTLFAAEQSYDGLYFPNGQRRLVRCGVHVDVPAGITVEIWGLYGNEVNGLNVIPQRIHGPFTKSLELVIWNHAPATVKLDPYTPIANIRAYASPKPAVWIDESESAAAA
jgi:dUTPase